MNIKGKHADFLPSGLTPDMLYDHISKNADKHEPSMQWKQPLTEEELNDFRAKFADEAIEKNAETEAMKEEVKVLKGKISAIEKSMAEKLKFIQDKEVTIIEPGFGFKDFDSRTFYWVNAEGIVIGSRPMDGIEMQTSIPMAKVKNLHKKKNHEEPEVTEVDRPGKDE